MIDRISLLPDLLKVLNGETPDNELTTSLLALLGAEKTKIEEYFSQVVDQTTFKTEDYLRLKDFLINLVASLRTCVTTSKYLSDPRSLSNIDLDELFRSFGFPYSTKIRGTDENPPEQKIQLLYNLINLYKIKGTPDSIVRILQYFGLEKFDLFELVLKLVNSELVFESKFVAGTSTDSDIDTIRLPFEDLTKSDPHWLLTKDQILHLNNTNKLNLPSQSPYVGLQIQSVIDSAKAAIFSRMVQDQYQTWKNGGTLENDARITIINEKHSLLELYLATVYTMNKVYNLETTSDRFVCYDGSNVSITSIFDDFEQITNTVPIRRCDINDNEHIENPSLITENDIRYCSNSKLVHYYDLFTRSLDDNFLKTRESAGDLLDQINPDLKQSIDMIPDISKTIISLRKDLSYWIQGVIGLGFIDLSYMFFSSFDLFNEYKPVIDFFKPYQARFLLLMIIGTSINRLFNSIIVNETCSFDMLFSFHDFITANSQPCCITLDSTSCLETVHICKRALDDLTIHTKWKGNWFPDQHYSVNDVVVIGNETLSHFICIQNHTASNETKPGFGDNWSLYWKLYSHMSCTEIEQALLQDPRKTYDCGSSYDIGSSTDIPKDVQIDIYENKREPLLCPRKMYFDSTSACQFVHNGEYTDYLIKVYWQASNVPTYDGVYENGNVDENSQYFFDCWFPSDFVEIRYEPVDSFLITVDELYYITLETGDKIIV